MSRKISQTNISAYFSQPIRGDLHLYRSADTLLLPRILRKYDKCLTGICIRGEAHFTMVGMKRVIKPNQIFCFLPGHFVAIDSVSEILQQVHPQAYQDMVKFKEDNNE